MLNNLQNLTISNTLMLNLFVSSTKVSTISKLLSFSPITSKTPSQISATNNLTLMNQFLFSKKKIKSQLLPSIVTIFFLQILSSGSLSLSINNLNSQLSKCQTIRDLGLVKRFLGLDIYRPTSTGPLYISQSSCSRKILHHFSMENCNPTKAPLLSESTQLQLLAEADY